jgi:CBS-domain-containing membrane protein
VTDETLPKGSFSFSGDTIVALRDGKLVIFLPPEDRMKMVNVAAIMNRGAYTTTEGSPLSKTYSMFTSLGLRHLVVLGSGGKVSGIITR